MHVGWVATFDPPEAAPRPTFDALATHIAGRLDHAPRYRQRLVEVPLAVHEPVWVDDPEFDVFEHLRPAAGRTLDEVVDAVLSTPLARDRPLWEMWLLPELADGRIAMVGKAHHCMVDGIAALQLANLLLDREPGVPHAGNGHNGWSPIPAPSPSERLARAVAERAEAGAALALAPLRLAGSPHRLRTVPGAARRGMRTLAHTVLPPARSSPLNRPGSRARHLERRGRPLDDLRGVRRRYGVTLNDAVLAACAGALRRFALRRGDEPRPLKAMVPVDVRSAADAAGTGNRISFLFVELPCHEPDPLVRLMSLNRATAQRKRDGEPRATRTPRCARSPSPRSRSSAPSRAAGRAPAPVQPRRLERPRARAAALPARLPAARALPGRPAGRPPRAVDRRRDRRRPACFGLYADAVTLPDADALADDLDASIDELLDLCS